VNKIVAAALGVIFSSPVLPQNSPTLATPLVQRKVHGQTIVSQELPAAEVTFSNDFRYIGGQSVNLYGNAEAEQHLFVAVGRCNAIQRFYWLQFEHFLPSNDRTCDYEPTRTTDIGGLTFIYDVRVSPTTRLWKRLILGQTGLPSASSWLIATFYSRRRQCALASSIYPLPTAGLNS
jgi:hypothetical protein